MFEFLFCISTKETFAIRTFFFANIKVNLNFSSSMQLEIAVSECIYKYESSFDGINLRAFKKILRKPYLFHNCLALKRNKPSHSIHFETVQLDPLNRAIRRKEELLKMGWISETILPEFRHRI